MLLSFRCKVGANLSLHSPPPDWTHTESATYIQDKNQQKTTFNLGGLHSRLKQGMARGHETTYPKGFINSKGTKISLVGEWYCKQAIESGKTSSKLTSTIIYPTMGLRSTK